ncbi:S41 family peptidase [Adhaeribacter radiodurans]|uniref:S41 family peptidase n=1 Tax=Adhaeribacter radiodurans TaxID=2745197 RepID=A0A7L7L7X2_9BACT|nr:S41 family peptidase [Adhaeribacter radiodurans]QMU28635.1 S41 family peptidase [Adhaeribacter radiodurans]
MKKLFSNFFTLIGIWLSLSACEDTLVGPVTPNNPEQNFEQLWHEYDQLSAFISVKNINWEALYAQYRPQVKPTTTDAELFKIFTEMLAPLNDSHLTLLAPGTPPMQYDGGLAGQLKHEDFSLKVVKEHYLTEAIEYSPSITYGKLAPQIGYIYLKDSGLDEGYYQKALDKIYDYLKDTDGLVLDLRDFEGGYDKNSAYIAGRFATTKKLFMTSRKRNGPKHTDFTTPVNWYVQPEGKNQYTKPLVILTNRWTTSSGEVLLWALKAAKPVVQVGDTTLGAYSDQARRELPNGWYYTISINDIRAVDGKSYEGIGIAPDILVENKKAEVLAGKDAVLEKALTVVH